MFWWDGRLHDGPCAPFDLTDRGLLLGDGLFDTAMALGGRVAFEDAHVDRLAAGADFLGFRIDRDRVVSGMRALAKAMPRAVIRTTITRGSGPRGLLPPEPPHPIHWASTAPLNSGIAFSPITMMVVPIRRNETSPAAKVKTLGYLDAILATREVRAQGYDEPLFLNTKSQVACAGTGNVFLMEKDALSTPALENGALPGIIRNLIISTIAPALGIPIREASTFPCSLDTAEAIFITNSLRLVAPVSHMNFRNIPYEGGPILNRIIKAVRTAVAESCHVTADHVT